MNKNEIVQQLYQIEAIKTGDFTLKSGMTSPIYVDMRGIISYPVLLSAIAQLQWQLVEHLSFDLLCGVPYTALPIATCLSLQFNKPMVMVRKEAKSYGTKKMIEGHFKEGQSCVVIEDVVTSGSSIITTMNELKNAGLQVTHAVAFLDREQGGETALLQMGCQLHSVFTLRTLIKTLADNGIRLPDFEI